MRLCSWNTAAVAGDDAGAFLAAVLEGVEAVVRQIGGVGMAVNAEHAAVMFWIIVFRIQKAQCKAAPPKFKAEAEFFILAHFGAFWLAFWPGNCYSMRDN
jgi:hypothetical protein